MQIAKDKPANEENGSAAPSANSAKVRGSNISAPVMFKA